jgi:DNA-binding transcriptional LysR family regulator
MRIDPSRLIRLGELINHGSFKKAAEALCITQPALSQSIAHMEAEVGVRLIDRTPHGIVPTIFGDALLQHAREINWQLSEAVNRISELTVGRRDVLSIGGTSGGALTILTLAVCRLREQRSDIQMRIVEETWTRALLTQIEDRSLDIIICHKPDETELVGKVALPIFQGRRYLCVRKGHPQANRLSLDALASYPFACPGGEMGISHEIRNIFNDLKLEFPKEQVIILNSLTASKEVLLNTDAFAIFSDLSVLRESRDGSILMREISDIVEPYWYHMVVREDHVGSDLLLSFLSSVRAICQGFGIALHPDIDRIRSGRPLR